LSHRFFLACLVKSWQRSNVVFDDSSVWTRSEWYCVVSWERLKSGFWKLLALFNHQKSPSASRILRTRQNFEFFFWFRWLWESRQKLLIGALIWPTWPAVDSPPSAAFTFCVLEQRYLKVSRTLLKSIGKTLLLRAKPGHPVEREPSRHVTLLLSEPFFEDWFRADLWGLISLGSDKPWDVGKNKRKRYFWTVFPAVANNIYETLNLRCIFFRKLPKRIKYKFIKLTLLILIKIYEKWHLIVLLAIAQFFIKVNLFPLSSLSVFLFLLLFYLAVP